VQQVDVDLPNGKVIVTSAAPVDTDQVRAAVAEAGYQLVN
jgi:copper chaperone